MKILHVINALPAGGAEIHLLRLCRQLKLFGVEVMVACLKEFVKGSRSLRNDFELEGVQTVGLGGERRFDPTCTFRLARLIARERPDVLHTHLPRGDFAGAVSSFFGSRVPWVCSIHDLYSESWSGKWSLPVFSWIWRHADAVVAISHAVKGWLVDCRSIPNHKITVIHYGIDADRFDAPSENLRKVMGLESGLLLGSVGRLEERKGHKDLIRAMPAILERFPKACLLIAGPDLWGYGRILKACIAELKLEGAVRLIGLQSDIVPFLHAIDVFVFPSHSEGFGQAIIEAMAAGRPVVANRISAIPEIVVDGVTGILVAPNDRESLVGATSRLLVDEDLRRRLGVAGRQRVRDLFSVERMTRDTIAVYENVLARR